MVPERHGRLPVPRKLAAEGPRPHGAVDALAAHGWARPPERRFRSFVPRSVLSRNEALSLKRLSVGFTATVLTAPGSFGLKQESLSAQPAHEPHP